MGAKIHYAIAALLGLGIVLESYDQIKLQEIIGRGGIEGIIVLFGVYLVSKFLLAFDEEKEKKE